MDILGTIGGFYEVLYITVSFFLKKLIDLSLKKSLKKKVIKDNKQWFSYPSRIYQLSKKSNKVQKEDLNESKDQFKGKRKEMYKG